MRSREENAAEQADFWLHKVRRIGQGKALQTERMPQQAAARGRSGRFRVLVAVILGRAFPCHPRLIKTAWSNAWSNASGTLCCCVQSGTTKRKYYAQDFSRQERRVDDAPGQDSKFLFHCARNLRFELSLDCNGCTFSSTGRENQFGPISYMTC